MEHVGNMMRGGKARRCRALTLVLGAACFASAANAQLTPERVLVVYDSRIADSLAVAEYYAGSASVPGGVGGLVGKRPGVRTYDLAAFGGPVFSSATIDRSEYRTRLAAPLAAHLTATDSAGMVRCLVMTKGLPHRIENVGNAGVGDNPGLVGTIYGAGNYNAASVDSELTLLYQNLGFNVQTQLATELGGNADSRLDGYILNPYFRSALPITSWSTVNRTVQKNFVSAVASPTPNIGEMWSAIPLTTTATPTPTQLTPGDMYLVTRLDGNTVADVRAMLDRAAPLTVESLPGGNIAVNVNTAGVVLDESASDGSQSTANNGELDNAGYNVTYFGDDYEQTRDFIISDRRYLGSNIKYDAASNKTSFVVGARISYAGQGRIIDSVAAPLPLILLSHYGANHAGTVPGDDIAMPPFPPNPRTTYAASFTYAAGAVFNSMESYNARNLGGLTGGVAQQQVADFIGAGGTFATGNVYEPFTITVPDSALLARGFVLGNLTWGEAAMTALPVISFQQIVLGDPLARLVRSIDDRDGDGQLSIEDLYIWNANPVDINRSGGAGNDVDRRFIEQAVRSSNMTDMRGLLR